MRKHTFSYGPAYEPLLDGKAIHNQVSMVYKLMLDSKWRTLEDINRITRISESSASACLRHLRKKEFGKHEVLKRRKSKRIWEYMMVHPKHMANRENKYFTEYHKTINGKQKTLFENN